MDSVKPMRAIRDYLSEAGIIVKVDFSPANEVYMQSVNYRILFSRRNHFPPVSGSCKDLQSTDGSYVYTT